MTELIWDGKYRDGERQGPVKIALPFQTIETVNESAQERQRSLELFSAGREAEWRNHLIWGDKKYLLPSLLAEFAGKVNLIYIDPPFNTGQDFSYSATIPDHAESQQDEETAFLKQPSIIEQKAYRDTWGVSAEDRARGVSQLDRYVRWFYETVSLLRELLHDEGTIYVHLDQNVVHYVKPVMDEVFGLDAFLNHVVWSYRRWPSVADNFQTMHDDILVYARNPNAKRVFNIQYEPPSESYLKRFKGKTQVLDPETRTRKLVESLDFVGGKVEQRGMGFHNLCGWCNNFLNRYYVREYLDWSQWGMYVLANAPSGAETFSATVTRVRPLRFLKQCFAMASYINHPEFLDLHVPLRKFILDPEEKALPPKFDMYLTLYKGPRARTCGLSGKVDLYTGAVHTMSEVAFPPFAIVMAVDSPPHDQFGRITGLRQFGLDEVVDVRLDLRIGEGHTPFPTDYRTRRQVEREAGHTT